MPAMKQTVRLTPLAWDLAGKYSLSLEELASIAGSGEAGRITDEDLLQCLASRGRLAAPVPSVVTQPTGVDTAVTQEPRPDRQRKRWLVAVGIWVLWFLAGVVVQVLKDAPSSSSQGAAALIGLPLVACLIYAVARLAVFQGRKWYEVFGLLVPIVNLILIGRLFWYWAGLAVGTKPEITRPTARTMLSQEDAHKKLAEQAAEAVRAADERAPH